MRKIIAIDFDGCLCSNAFPNIGTPNEAVIKAAKEEQQAGAALILWTCRTGKSLQEAISACSSWGLSFDAINESLPEQIKEFGATPRKIYATEYWDDRAVKADVHGIHRQYQQPSRVQNTAPVVKSVTSKYSQLWR